MFVKPQFNYLPSLSHVCYNSQPPYLPLPPTVDTESSKCLHNTKWQEAIDVRQTHKAVKMYGRKKHLNKVVNGSRYNRGWGGGVISFSILNISGVIQLQHRSGVVCPVPTTVCDNRRHSSGDIIIDRRALYCCCPLLPHPPHDHGCYKSRLVWPEDEIIFTDRYELGMHGTSVR